MNVRLRVGVAILAVLLLGNLVWRIWSGWGLITVNVDDARMADVVSSIERQAGVRIVTNIPADRKTTLHVDKVPLVRALQALSNESQARWDVAFLAGPDKSWIEGTLAAFSNDGSTDGWSTYGSPMMGGMMIGEGLFDPRDEKLENEAIVDAKMQDFLQVASRHVDGQFWAPQDWNPDVKPKAGRTGEAVAKAAASAGGVSAEVIILTAPPANSPPQAFARGGNPPPDGEPAPPGQGSQPGAQPRQFDFATMANRQQARINTLPPERRAEAQKRFDEQQKFFQSLASLPPEERGEKMREHIEEEIRSDPDKFQSRMTRMDASHTVEERTNFFRHVVERKEEAEKQ